MKSADYKERNYQFKTNINMKIKTSILAVTKAFFILLVIGCLSSCSNKNDGYFKKETIKTKLIITEVYKAKYSIVKGYIIYNNIRVPIDNGGDGYYYKDYNLTVGSEINTLITIYYYSTNHGYELVFSDADVSVYENNR
jgi:hypothetical protein